MAEKQKSSIKAVHLPGGNYFDDMRIDIQQSHQRFDSLLSQKKQSINQRLVTN